MSLNEREALFLRTLGSFAHGHVGQDTLRSKLLDQGMDEQEFKTVKKKLLYSGVIGIVYGNITLEDKGLRELLAEELESEAVPKEPDKEKA
jgi:hypothetical protein